MVRELLWGVKEQLAYVFGVGGQDFSGRARIMFGTLSDADNASAAVIAHTADLAPV